MNKELEVKEKSAKKYLNFQFLNLGNFFKKAQEPQISPIIITEIEINPFEEKFDQFYNLDKIDLVLELLKNGYQPNTTQINKINSFIEDKLHNASNNNAVNCEGLIIVNSYIELGFTLNEILKETICRKIFLKENNSIIEYDLLLDTSDNIKIKILPNHPEVELNALTKELRDYLHSHNVPLQTLNWCFSENITPKIKSFTNNVQLQRSFFKDFLSVMEHHPQSVLEILHFDDYLLVMSKINYKSKSKDYNYENCHKIAIYMDQHFKYYESNVNELLADVKNNNMQKYVEKKTTDIINANIKNIKFNNLPQKAEDILTLINQYNQQISYFLKSHPSHELNNDFDIQNLLEKRLPEILQKYFSIDESYRLTLKNSENKNAQELMLDSLNNIKNNIEKKLERINEDKLSDLSSTNRYTRHFK